MYVYKIQIPFIYNQESGDEVFGFFWCIYKLLFLKVPPTGQDVIQSLIVIITEEGTQTAQTSREKGKDDQQRFVDVRACFCVFTYSIYVITPRLHMSVLNDTKS